MVVEFLAIARDQEKCVVRGSAQHQNIKNSLGLTIQVNDVGFCEVVHDHRRKT